MARFYSNENFPLPVVERLRELGHDVLTTIEAGKANQRIADEEVVEFAASQGRAVLTLNRKHFVRIHEAGRLHAGIIVCTFDLLFSAQADRIHRTIENIADLTSRLIRINRPG